jgi:hypothetical protein
MDWAYQLHLPVIGMAAEKCEQELACAAACARRHVPFEMACRKEQEVAAPTDLLVFGHALPAALKKNLLHAALGETGPAMLVCPDVYAAPQRILLLDQGNGDRACSLPIVASLCRGFGAKLVLLTVAHAENESRRRQQDAQTALASLGLNADCDCVIGSEVRVAVVGVARWRRCQLVVMSRQVSPPWWRRLRDSTPDWFMGLTQPLAFLSLPHVEPLARSTLPHARSFDPIAKVQVNVDR